MKVLKGDFTDIKPAYPIESLLPEGRSLSDVLFLDIETTGLTPANSDLYLIGCVSYSDDCWHYTQFFAEKYEEELQILKEFIVLM